MAYSIYIIYTLTLFLAYTYVYIYTLTFYLTFYLVSFQAFILAFSWACSGPGVTLHPGTLTWCGKGPNET